MRATKAHQGGGSDRSVEADELLLVKTAKNILTGEVCGECGLGRGEADVGGEREIGRAELKNGGG